MEYGITHFCKKDINLRKRCYKEFFKEQKKDFLVSYLFIFMSSSVPVISIMNGAFWVFLWYTFSIVIALYAYISQSECNKGVKRAKHYMKKHGYTVKTNIPKRFSNEIGGFSFVFMQFGVAMLFGVILCCFATVYQFYDYSEYMKEYKQLCLGIFVDTYVVTFCNVYRMIISDLLLVPGWKQKIDKLLHVFCNGSVLKTIVSHVCAILIVLVALRYFFTNEFSGLFGPTLRKVIGTIYIVYMFKDLKDIIKK